MTLLLDQRRILLSEPARCVRNRKRPGVAGQVLQALAVPPIALKRVEYPAIGCVEIQPAQHFAGCLRLLDHVGDRTAAKCIAEEGGTFTLFAQEAIGGTLG